ncbi:MAG: hypothetical protein KDK12_06990 [Rhodobacteraceae bacterium]|nr:hypothetical protein [Paracoccaceae bacterium]
MPRFPIVALVMALGHAVPLPAAAVAPICYNAPVFPQPGATVGIDSRVLCIRIRR